MMGKHVQVPTDFKFMSVQSVQKVGVGLNFEVTTLLIPPKFVLTI